MKIENRDHYSLNRAGEYHRHHKKSLRARLTSERELAFLASALQYAQRPDVVLDLPCGTGRFWPAIAEAGVGRLIAGDYSEGMLAVAEGNRLGENLPAELIRTSVFDIDLADKSVDFVACMRFFHHLYHQEDRLQALAELRRVSRRHVAISLWVDGNLASWRRRGNKPPPERGYSKRVCINRRDIEADFITAGFKIIQVKDVWPRISMWRMYLLEVS